MNRRSRASAFYRFTMKRHVWLGAMLLIVCGWTLMLVAAPGPLEDLPAPVTFLGGAIAFMGFFAGISRWVADPAARKVLLEHTRAGIDAHPELLGRAEFNATQVVLSRQITNLRLDVRGLIAELRGGHHVTANDTGDGE